MHGDRIVSIGESDVSDLTAEGVEQIITSSVARPLSITVVGECVRE